MAYRALNPLHLIWIIHLAQRRFRPALVNYVGWSFRQHGESRRRAQTPCTVRAINEGKEARWPPTRSG